MATQAVGDNERRDVPEGLAAEAAAFLDAARRYREYLKRHHRDRLAGVVWTQSTSGELALFTESGAYASRIKAVRLEGGATQAAAQAKTALVESLRPGALFRTDLGQVWLVTDRKPLQVTALRVGDPKIAAFNPGVAVEPVDLPALLAERADLLALLEIARRDTDGAELGAAREREEAIRLLRGTAHGARQCGEIADAELLGEMADAMTARGPCLPAGPLETEQARADALAAENAQLKEALNGMVDACVQAHLDGGPVRLLHRALALARKALGVGQ